MQQALHNWMTLACSLRAEALVGLFMNVLLTVCSNNSCQIQSSQLEVLFSLQAQALPSYEQQLHSLGITKNSPSQRMSQESDCRSEQTFSHRRTSSNSSLPG
jgi:hypothetical protein